MKKLIVAATLAAATSTFAPGSALPGGCVAISPDLPAGLHYGGSPTCTYRAEVPGNIVASGRWRVEVWWGGVCDRGTPDWVRSSFDGDDNVAGRALAAWEGSIAAGSCARATALSDGTVVAIGEVRPA